VQALAAAAEAAHQSWVALSIDHPSRMRVSTEGDVALAFPATMPDARPQDDIRGIGAALYALLVNRWPLQEPQALSGWARAQLDPEGRAKEPAAVNPEIPFLISAAAAGSVRQGGGIRSAATVLTLLQQAACEADNGEPSCPVREPPALPPPGCYASFRDSRPTQAAEARRRRGMLVGLGAGAAVMVVVLMMLTSTLSHILGNGDARIALDKDKLGLHGASSTPAHAAPPAAGGPVKPVQATVFSPGGGVDNPQSAGLAIDGNPATAWSTDTYFDAVPFPKFKDGVGLLLQLPQPTALSAVTVDLDSAGTVVQIRSSPSATPARLADTTELTPPTPMQPGHNTIPVNNPKAAPNVLVWISTLGTTGGKSRSDISEITLQAVSPPA
jgi:putative peptidoglycan lipid II flippase